MSPTILPATLVKAIDEIPGSEGWWKGPPSGVHWVARKLLDKGFTEEEIVHMISDIYSDVAAEFGN